jgi:tRNA-specific 2-thiouridylase
MSQKNPNKVILGLSGGVDSTTAALLLKEKGLFVTGVFLDVTGDNAEGRQSAEKAAEELKIPLLNYNVEEAFHKEVISYFKHEYLEGRTPNPCVVCNPHIKFKVLEEVADKLDATYISTGHYARTYYDQDLDRWFIRKSTSASRDQSYMLYRLPQEIISRLILPLGELKGKNRVREIAETARMTNATKKDSQEICFLPKGKSYAQYLESQGISAPPGHFVDSKGHVLGEHAGLYHYTIGQRKGLGGSFGKPMFVKAIRKNENTIVLSEEEQDLFTSKVISTNNIMNIPFEGLKVKAKIRYAAKPSEAFIRTIEDNRIEALFDEPQRAPTPGQSMVFYLEEFVVGGGFIE